MRFLKILVSALACIGLFVALNAIGREAAHSRALLVNQGDSHTLSPALESALIPYVDSINQRLNIDRSDVKDTTYASYGIALGYRSLNNSNFICYESVNQSQGVVKSFLRSSLAIEHASDLIDVGENSEALQFLHHIHREWGRSGQRIEPAILGNKAIALANLGKYGEALHFLNEMESTLRQQDRPTDFRLYQSKALVLKQQGNISAAHYFLEAAEQTLTVQNRIDDPRLVERMARLYMSIGKYAHAEVLASRALHLYTKDASRIDETRIELLLDELDSAGKMLSALSL